MKTILAATDFSENAKTAAFYAAEVAKRMDATLYLLHAYHFPAALSTVPTSPAVFDEIVDEYSKRLKDVAREIKQKIGKELNVECLTLPGFAVDTILDVCDVHGIELVVLGTQGVNGIELALLGSIASDIIRKCPVPVLVVPPETQFHEINNIVFACNKCELAGPKAHDVISRFVNAFHARVALVDIVREHEEIEAAKEESHKITSRLGDLAPAVHVLENKKVTDGIKDFIRSQHADLLVMVPEQHAFFDRLFSEIHTRRMAVSTPVPMLTIHC